MLKTKNINICICEEEYNDIANQAHFFGSTISEFVLEAIRERLEYLEDVRDLTNRDKNASTTSNEDLKKELGLL